MRKETDTEPDPRDRIPVAREVLAKAKVTNANRCCELRIDERTVIMVTPENNNPVYSKAYREKLGNNLIKRLFK